MRTLPLLLLSVAAIVVLLPSAAAEQDGFATDASTPRRGKPAVLNPHGAHYCASTDDPAQCAALVDLWQGTNGDKWVRNTGWLRGSSYCGWYGVTCLGTGNVTYL